MHGLVNYIDTLAKCHYIEILTCKGTLGQVFISMTGDTFSHVGIFDQAL
jgi:hypothetical protein